MTHPESAIVARATQRDPLAFAALVDRYTSRCHRLANRYLDDPDDAADAVQEAFIRAYTGLDRFDGEGSFASWLFTIVANRCRTASVRTRRHIAMDEASLPMAASDPWARDPLLAARLSDALAELPHETRVAIVRRHVGGASYEDLARTAGVSVSAMKMRVARGTARLRGILVASGITLVAVAMLVHGRVPARSERAQTSAVMCDTLRSLMRDTLGPAARDTMLPYGRCGHARDADSSGMPDYRRMREHE